MASSDEITSEPSVDQFRRRRSFPIHLPTWPFQFHVNAGASNSGDDSVQALPMQNGGSSVTCLYQFPVNAGASNSDNDSVNTFPMQNASFSVEPVGLNDPFWQLRSFTSPFRTLFSRFHVNAGAAPSSGDDSVHVLPRHNRSTSGTWLSRFFVNAGASNSDNDSVNTFPMQNTSFSVEPVGFNDPFWQLRSFTSPLGTLLTRFHVNAGAAPSSDDDSVLVLPRDNRSSSATWLSRFFVNAEASNSDSVNTFQMQNASFSVESVGVNDPFMQLRSITSHLGTFLTRFHHHVNAWVPSSDDDSVHVLPMHNRVSNVDVKLSDPLL